MSRRLRATDKRDYVFALLNIFGPFKSELPSPDYRKSAPDVFTGITTRFLKLLGPFDILREATNVDNGLSIPSWVPNWSQRPQFHIPPSEGLYHVSGRSKAKYKVSGNGKELRGLGKHIDRLLKVSKVELAAYRNPYVPSKGIIGYQQSCCVGLSMKTYPTGEDIKEVLWRTLCWNLDADQCVPAAKEFGIHFEAFHRILVSGKDMKIVERELLDEAAGFNDICVHSMPLTVTSNGYLASVPWMAEEGDCIAVFAGGELPFVLRRNEDSETYCLIGACYVHSVMDGEAFPEDPRNLEWLTIR
jgi:hypothetical protein